VKKIEAVGVEIFFVKPVGLDLARAWGLIFALRFY